MEKAAVDALWNEHFVSGESVVKFEEEFARYCGVDCAVSTSSGTAALSIALTALGVKNGASVITTPASFVATANAVLHSGGTPRFADIDMQTYDIDPEGVKAAVEAGTRAVIPVHLYGFPADINSLKRAGEKKGLAVVEDACQAHGATYKGRRAGSFGDVACFSFYPSKNMTVAGDGGMLVTNDEEIAHKAAKLRDCGRQKKYVHDLVGYTARLNTVNAAIGRVQLKHLDEWNVKRRRNAETYDRLLSDLEELYLPPAGDKHTRPVYHLYVVRTSMRDGLEEWLQSRGIECGVHYPLPIHLQPVYVEMFGFKTGTYPNAEELCRTCLSIPMYPDLSEKEIGFVCEQIHEFFENR
jgi:perosamine synthetase